MVNIVIVKFLCLKAIVERKIVFQLVLTVCTGTYAATMLRSTTILFYFDHDLEESNLN